MSTTTTTPAHHESGLDKTPSERCEAYGVQFKQDDAGRWFAWHLRAGATPAHDTREAAAFDACNRWGI